MAAVLLFIAAADAGAGTPEARDTRPGSDPSYVLIGWNDLGMHCSALGSDGHLL